MWKQNKPLALGENDCRLYCAVITSVVINISCWHLQIVFWPELFFAVEPSVRQIMWVLSACLQCEKCKDKRRNVSKCGLHKRSDFPGNRPAKMPEMESFVFGTQPPPCKQLFIKVVQILLNDCKRLTTIVHLLNYCT